MMLTNLFPLFVLISAAVQNPRHEILTFLDTDVKEWRFHIGEINGAEKPGYDDTKWPVVGIGHRWLPHDSTCWFRANVTIPDTIMGFPTNGQRIRLILGMDNEAAAYVNGEEKQRFQWREGDVILTENAQPGETISVALHGINRPGFGCFLQARLGTDDSLKLQSSLQKVIDEIDLIESYLSDGDAVWRAAIQRVYESIGAALSSASPGKINDLSALAPKAEAILLQAASSTPERLDGLTRELTRLDRSIEQGRSLNLAMDYIKQKSRVIRSFIVYARDDYAGDSLWKKIRAERIAAYLEKLTAIALHDANDLLAHPENDRPVPRYKTGKVEIRDGAFWQNGHPIYFNGVGHFGQVRQDIPILPDYGFNIIQIEIGPNSVIEENGSVNLKTLESNILQPLQDAEKHNVAVCVLLSPHYMPTWAFQKHPELADGGHGFIKYDIDHPAARGILERFLRAVVPKMAAYRSLHSFCLSNEPQYVSRSQISADLFHQWLQKRHQTIEQLNKLYGTLYASFDQVPQAETDSPEPACIDWRLFNQDRFRDWHRWMAGIIHEHAPDIPVHAKSMAHAWGGAEHFELGVNHEDFAHLGRITGNDCVTAPTREKEYPYAQHWMLQAMHYDFQRSAAPENPIFNSENHLIPDDNAVFTPGEHIYTALWQGALYGMGASTIWVWERGESKTTFDNILTRPQCVEAAGRASLDLMRLAPLIARFANAKPPIGLFYSWISHTQTDDSRNASAAAYEGLANLGLRIKIVTEKTIQEGALNELPIVVLPKTARVHADSAKVFAEYIQRGGVVIALEPCFTQDEYGRPNPQLAQWLEKGERLGRAVRLNTPVTAQAIRDLAGERLKQMGRSSPVAITDPYGSSLWGVLWLTLDDGGYYLVNIVNMRREDQSIRLPLSANALATDLISGESYPREFVLPPLYPMLLKIAKKDMEAIRIDNDLY
ncbi:MAG: beta-galactosidase [Candidatus Omnitrophota bacterium]